MGISLSNLMSPLSGARGRKRHHDEDSDSESVIDKALNTPKRRKLKTTSQYIYQALFKEEKNSDVTVTALGKSWHLHKVYLNQSPYFASMFSGSWKETDQDFVHIEIIDPRVTLDSLTTVFGSFYLDEVTLDPKGIISILATATLFQLEGIIDQCAAVMKETINTVTAVSYYEVACEYGVKCVKDAAFKWLLVNLLGYFFEHVKWLREINADLMHKLIASPDLFVVQTEFSVYILLKHWIYLMLHPDWSHSEDTEKEPRSFFQERKDKTPFLLTTRGAQFAKPFRALRINHILMHHLDIETLQKDNIIPMDWISPAILQQWYGMLRIDQGLDKGPTEVNEALFYEHCLRCGRILPTAGNHMWRWTGFNFGLDLILILEDRSFRIKRNHRLENGLLLSFQNKRNILFRITVASLNEQRQVNHIQTTDIKAASLGRNEQTGIFALDEELTFPILVSVNLLVKTPPKFLEDT